MDLELIKIFNELIDLFDTSSLIKEINELKKEIYDDIELKELFAKYKSIDNNYNNEIIDLKRKISSNAKIKRFRLLQNELNLLIMEINKRLASLTNEKRCGI